MKKMFKDPKVTIVSCKDFLYNTNFLRSCTNKLNTNETPEPYISYYDISSKYLTEIIYGIQRINYGLTSLINLYKIKVAIRNGVEEYECFFEDLAKLKEQCAKMPNSEKYKLNYNNMLKNIRYIKKNLPVFEKNKPLDDFTDFKDYLIHNLYIAKNKKIACSYVVLDIETNGLRKANDDILSITIYDPYLGVAYNRFLPLELQPVVLTGYVNGIKKEDLENQKPLSQDEFNQIVEYFNLKNRKILVYGSGNFDRVFLSKYCLRHKIQGFENLNFENIKDHIFSNSIGLATKDNICKVYNITSGSDKHSSLNDCIIEWKLFEHVYNKRLIIVNNQVYEVKKGYVMPITNLLKHFFYLENLGYNLTKLHYDFNLIYEESLPKNIISKIKKYEGNITGFQIEDVIYSLLRVKRCDNRAFVTKNNTNLKFLGRLCDVNSPLENDFNDKNLLNLNDEELNYDKPVKMFTTSDLHSLTIEDYNDISFFLGLGLQSAVQYIKRKIFSKSKIKAQELVLSKDAKIYAMCDLSSENAVLEIKAFDIERLLFEQRKIAAQLYYQRNGRKTFVMSIVFKEKKKGCLQDVIIRIYQVDIKEIKKEG